MDFSNLKKKNKFVYFDKFTDLVKEFPETQIKQSKGFKPKKLNYQGIKENKPTVERKEMKKQAANSDNSIIELDEEESLSTKEYTSSNNKGAKKEPEPIDDLNSLLKGIENINLDKNEPKKEKLKDSENKEKKKKEDKVEEENKKSIQEEYIPLSMRMKKMYKGASIFN
jgi:hypothetical protein